jgi:hypothetical protein
MEDTNVGNGQMKGGAGVAGAPGMIRCGIDSYWFRPRIDAG